MMPHTRNRSLEGTPLHISYLPTLLKFAQTAFQIEYRMWGANLTILNFVFEKIGAGVKVRAYGTHSFTIPFSLFLSDTAQFMVMIYPCFWLAARNGCITEGVHAIKVSRFNQQY